MHTACCSYVLYSGCEKYGSGILRRRQLETLGLSVGKEPSVGTGSKPQGRSEWHSDKEKCFLFCVLCVSTLDEQQVHYLSVSCSCACCPVLCSPTFPCVLNAVFSVQYTYSFRVLRVFLLSFNMQCFILECSVCSCNVLYSLCSLMLSLVFCVFRCSQLILVLFLCAPGFSVFLRF